jgi:hypothetical protein
MNYFIKFFVLTSLMMAVGCEVDDICTEAVLTPKLIIRFYDTANPDAVKEATGLYVWAEAKDSLYVNSTTDSIVLPLNTHLDETKYLLSSNSVVDTLYLFYDRQEIFVSRSCGFKYNFELTDETHLTSQWSDSMTTIATPQIVKDESAAHIKIFH